MENPTTTVTDVSNADDATVTAPVAVKEPEQAKIVTSSDQDQVDGVEFKIKQETVPPTTEQCADATGQPENIGNKTEPTEAVIRETHGLDSSFFESDEEDYIEREFDTTPFKFDWLDLGETISGEETERLAIGPLPGCRFKDTWRNIDEDLKFLKSNDIEDVFCLCTKGELRKFRTTNLVEKLEENDFTVHSYPCQDGNVPKMPTLMKILDDLKDTLSKGRKCFVQCFGGLGRSVLVAACLLMYCDKSNEPEKTIEKLRKLRGHSAVQTIKQYNFIHEFPGLLKEHQESVSNGSGDATSRCDSRTLSR
ncbi:cyclin-dependent kinase inhibitor 3-like [Tubulanus polymorphus]|uniref:cyclin-dependent kinase inhibitor 3-like n=1 Tax=Tubulanus polymorphus TaxID=672921 RepID=UPI003DA2CA8D